MANPESISYIRLNDVEYPIDAVTVGGKSASDFQEGNLVTSIDANSDDVQNAYMTLFMVKNEFNVN